jgi:hypothetical protein
VQLFGLLMTLDSRLGVEIHLKEGAGRSSEPTCCPSFLRVSRFRDDKAAHRYVLYERVWRRQ